MTDLPPGWVRTTIGEVADVQLGRQRSPKNHSGPHMRPYLRSANVTWKGIDLSDVKEMNFDPSEAVEFQLEPGDLLLNEASGSPNEVGKPAIWNGELDGFCFQNTLLRVRSKGPATAYLYWYCRSAALAGRFGEAGRGVNIRHLGKQGLATFPIPIPPLLEQERIVAAIEEHLSRVDAGVAALKRNHMRLEALQKSVVDETFANLKTAHKESGSELFPYVTSGSRGWAKYYSSTGAHFIRVGNVPRGGVRLDLSATQRVEPPEGVEGRRTKVLVGDVVITITADIGRVAVATEQLGEAYINQHVAIARPRSGVNADYLAWFIASAGGQKQLSGLQRGVTKAGLGLDDIRSLQIPIPPLDIQNGIAAKLSSLKDAQDSLMAQVAHQIRRSDTLRSTILAAAFNGRLALQNADEDAASVLIDRIRAERVGVPPARPRRRAS